MKSSGSFRPGFDARRCRPNPPPPAVRFWPRVRKALGCWEWAGRRSRRGYGEFDVGGGRVAAHRMAWLLARGPIPDGLLVCHACDNPACVRPDHLFLGTQSDNMCDMAAKGRHSYPRGEDHPSARLTNDDAAEIRRLYRAGGVTQDALARHFGVCQSHVSRIVREFERPRRSAATAAVYGPIESATALAGTGA